MGPLGPLGAGSGTAAEVTTAEIAAGDEEEGTRAEAGGEVAMAVEEAAAEETGMRQSRARRELRLPSGAPIASRAR